MPTRKTNSKTKAKPKVKQAAKKTPQRRKRVVVRSKKNNFQLKKWLALAGLIVGLNLILASGWYLLYRRTILSFHVSPSVTSELRREAPTHIAISGASTIDASVTQGVIKEGIWEVSDTSVVHLETSAYPGQPGNIIMYGHNSKKLFKYLPKTKVGDIISLNTDDNTTHQYKVTETMTVKPTQIEVVLPTDHEVLTVYTCTGWFDSLRFVVRAEPITNS